MSKYEFKKIESMNEYEYRKFINKDNRYKITDSGKMYLNLFNYEDNNLNKDEVSNFYSRYYILVETNKKINLINNINEFIKFKLNSNVKIEGYRKLLYITFAGDYNLMHINKETDIATIAPVISFKLRKGYNIVHKSYYLKYPIYIPRTMLYVIGKGWMDYNIEDLTLSNIEPLGEDIYSGCNEIKYNIENELIRKNIIYDQSGG